jgi:hypothetical protein
MPFIGFIPCRCIALTRWWNPAAKVLHSEFCERSRRITVGEAGREIVAILSNPATDDEIDCG